MLRWLKPANLAKLAKRIWFALTVLFLPFVYFLAIVVQAELDQSFGVPSSAKDMTMVDQMIMGIRCFSASIGSPPTLIRIGITFAVVFSVVLLVGAACDRWERLPDGLRAALSRIYVNVRDRLLLFSASSSILTLAVSLAFTIAVVAFGATMALIGQVLEASGPYATSLVAERQAMARRCVMHTSFISDLPCTELERKAGGRIVGLLVSTANGSFYLTDGNRTAVIASSDIAFIRTVQGTKKSPKTSNMRQSGGPHPAPRT